jgi:hypothetical protein
MRSLNAALGCRSLLLSLRRLRRPLRLRLLLLLLLVLPYLVLVEFMSGHAAANGPEHAVMGHMASHATSDGATKTANGVSR